MPKGDTYPLSEERRLFYVALTRARRSVAMFTVKGESSPFLDELVSESAVKVTTVDGMAIEEVRCPACKTGVIVPRTSEYGTFLGCSAFPRCRYKPPRRRAGGATPQRIRPRSSEVLRGATFPARVQALMVEPGYRVFRGNLLQILPATIARNDDGSERRGRVRIKTARRRECGPYALQ